MTDCPICCDQFNNSTKKKITCNDNTCGYSACKSCIRIYLLGTTADPHCMNCKKEFSDDFLVKSLNKNFCDKEYKNHRKELLLEREISKLPESIDAAEKHKKITVYETKNKELNLKIQQLNKELNEIKFEKNQNINTIYKIKHGQETNSERRKFIMSCPNDNCRGYLSSQYKCDLCEIFTCPHCLEIIGYSKDEPHTCNPDNVASAEMIKKDTKPCPQCGVRIHKIQGCNQMWCTQCKIAFDYVTLKIDTGVVHNPHYYQHLQQENNGQVPRNPQDILCGGLCGVRELNTYFKNMQKYYKQDIDYQVFVNYSGQIHRTISHLTYYDLPRVRTDVRNFTDNEQLRVKYIIGKDHNDKIYTKDDFKNDIYKQDVKRKKQNKLLHLYELISVVGIETFRMLISYKENDIKEYTEKKLCELDNLRQYCNCQFGKISTSYNCTVVFIDDSWAFTTKKYKLAEIKAD